MEGLSGLCFSRQEGAEIGERSSSQQKILQDRKGAFLPMVLGNDNSEREISQNICDDLSERPSAVPLLEQLRGL